ncbi:MAG: hypothetical protein ACOCRX_04390 [Candidatus Woesearchaeota archaeon]
MRVWLMKTKRKWFKDMKESKKIMIDQDGINDYYTNYTKTERLEKIKKSGQKSPKRVEKFFINLSKDMSIGDMVIIGTGQVGTFKISEIARITGDYKYDTSLKYDLKHYRNVEFYGLERKIPFEKWNWVNVRIQELPNKKLDEFAEVMTKILF